MDGIEVLTAAKRADPNVQVVLVTAHATIDTAVTPMRYGAFDYITKPFTSDELVRLCAARSMPRGATEGEHIGRRRRRRGRQSPRTRACAIVGSSGLMRAVLTLADRVAPTDSNVLIYGESGTGKEMLARYIHQMSRRVERPFLPVDCVSLNDALLESELFGHEKELHRSTCRQTRPFRGGAWGNTIFGRSKRHESQPPSSLLRVLQERQVRRVGGTRFTHVDVRVIGASNQDLEDLCRKGTFREDLYYRLNVIPVALPPLRSREGDILLLANEFVTRFVQRVQTDPVSVPVIDPSAADLLMRYAWPGNVRELQNVMERAAVLVDGHTVMSTHLPDRLQSLADKDSAPSESGSFKQAKQQAVENFERNFPFRAVETQRRSYESGSP